MSFRQEIRCDQLPPSEVKNILQKALDFLKIRIVMKRDWIGAVPSYELERSDAPPIIVKAQETPHGRGNQSKAAQKLPQKD